VEVDLKWLERYWGFFKNNWKYLIPILVSGFIYYFLEFVSLMILIVQVVSVGFMILFCLSFIVGMSLGIYSYGNEDAKAIRGLRLADFLAPIGWGYDLVVWLLEDESKPEKK